MARNVLAPAVAVGLLTTIIILQLCFGLFPADFLVNHGGQENLLPALHHSPQGAGDFLLGVGKADITGPVVEINLMGYADANQLGTGLRQRLYCRAFVIGSAETPSDRFVYLILDTQSGDAAIRYGILAGLKDLGPEYAIYTKDNVAVTGTHSHSGPGAWLNYLLPQITSKGFDKQSYYAIVTGSVLAIQRAHQSLTQGHLSIGSMEVDDININRSPYAYLANPKDERSKYKSDVDKTMTMLKFQRSSNNQTMGFITWFPVHGTSLFGNNTLVTGDNKGVAAALMEQEMATDNPTFVAGFSQSNVGDTSPNVLGAFCEDTGLQCRFNDSTCDGKTQGCHGRGPFFQYPDQGTKSCFEIGHRQYAAARSLLMDSGMKELFGPSIVSSFHTYANMSSYHFPSPFNGSQLKTCSAALGYGFAGGTTDGPGAFDFRQGTNDSDDNSPALKNPLWKLARGFIHDPSDEQIVCQHPKPILLDVGAATKPYVWTPNIVDIQLLRVGPVVIVVVPGEATTMSGRRWKNAIADAAPSVLGVGNPEVVLGGPANTYAHYIATEEEYQVQRYESASTLFGPNTLAAYINLTLMNLPYLGTPAELAKLPKLGPGPSPPIQVNASLSFITPVIVDSPGLFKSFGDIIPAPSASFYRPGDVPKTKFIGANPRNNLRLEGTFATIEKRAADYQTWSAVCTDRDWSLVYSWRRTSTVLGTSEVTISWEIEDSVEDGVYRMRYYGDSKALSGAITPFQGIGPAFTVRGGPKQDHIETELEK